MPLPLVLPCYYPALVHCYYHCKLTMLLPCYSPCYLHPATYPAFTLLPTLLLTPCYPATTHDITLLLPLLPGYLPLIPCYYPAIAMLLLCSPDITLVPLLWTLRLPCHYPANYPATTLLLPF